MGLTKEEARQILMSVDMVKYFEECLKYTNQIKSVWNFVTGDIASYLNKNGVSITNFIVEPNNIVKLLALFERCEISYSQARKIFEEMTKNN